MKIVLDIIVINLLFPVIFQLVYGIKAIHNRTPLKFKFVCFISIAIQIMLTILGILVMSNGLKKVGGTYVNGLPVIGFIIVNIFLILVMLVIMGIQFYIKVAHKNKLD